MKLLQGKGVYLVGFGSITGPGMAYEPDNIEVTPEMVAAGFKMLVDSGLLDLDLDAVGEPSTGSLLPFGRRPRWSGNEQVVADIYRAMVRARSSRGAVEVAPGPAAY